MRLEAGLAQSLRSLWSRFGPIVPVAPAAARVWQVLHPDEPVNTTLPADAEAELLEVALLDEVVLEEVALEGSADPTAAFGGGVPTGGGPLLGCLESHAENAEGLTTRTCARMKE